MWKSRVLCGYVKCEMPIRQSSRDACIIQDPFGKSFQHRNSAFFPFNSGSQSAAPRLAAALSSGNSLEVQRLRSHPRPTESASAF